MSFELPNLDKRSYDQLVAEMVRLIPQYTTQWTDFNDSDPGITLVQMLCWIDEMLLYQANQIPIETQQNFLRWVLGLAFSSNQTDYSKYAQQINDYDFLALQDYLAQLELSLPGEITKADIQKRVLEYQQAPYLALTASDIQHIALQTNLVIAARDAQIRERDPNATPQLTVKQAYVQTSQQQIYLYILSDVKTSYFLPGYPNYEYGSNVNKTRKTLLLKAPDENSTSQTQDLNTLVNNVKLHLEPRMILGSSVQVRSAQFTDINLQLAITVAANSQVDIILNALFATLFDYFLPIPKNFPPWQYNQAPQTEKLHQLILTVAGIESIDSLELSFYPTMVLSELSQLGCNTILADLPSGETALSYVGLPKLRLLDAIAITAQNNGGH